MSISHGQNLCKILLQIKEKFYFVVITILRVVEGHVMKTGRQNVSFYFFQNLQKKSLLIFQSMRIFLYFKSFNRNNQD
jgi:hypothetical protein